MKQAAMKITYLKFLSEKRDITLIHQNKYNTSWIARASRRLNPPLRDCGSSSNEMVLRPT
jgi:hypothetical protein